MKEHDVRAAFAGGVQTITEVEMAFLTALTEERAVRTSQRFLVYETDRDRYEVEVIPADGVVMSVQQMLEAMEHPQELGFSVQQMLERLAALSDRLRAKGQRRARLDAIGGQR